MSPELIAALIQAGLQAPNLITEIKGIFASNGVTEAQENAAKAILAKDPALYFVHDGQPHSVTTSPLTWPMAKLEAGSFTGEPYGVRWTADPRTVGEAKPLYQPKDHPWELSDNTWVVAAFGFGIASGDDGARDTGEFQTPIAKTAKLGEWINTTLPSDDELKADGYSAGQVKWSSGSGVYYAVTEAAGIMNTPPDGSAKNVEGVIS